MLLGFDKAFIEGEAFEKSHAASCDKFRSRSKYLQLELSLIIFRQGYPIQRNAGLKGALYL